MYLIDTNVISEIRKKSKANKGVKAFFKQAEAEGPKLFISVITLGELRRGVELIRHRGNTKQANQLEKWLTLIIDEYAENILDFTEAEAQELRFSAAGNKALPKHNRIINDFMLCVHAITQKL